MNETGSYAPIAIFCYKRLDTLQSCIEFLKKNPESKFSNLIIYSDAPSEVYEYDQILQVREYLNKIVGFNEIRIVLREENLGVDYNIIEGICDMSKRYDKFIVIEDDLIVSADFLRFMNKMLINYDQDQKILTVSGFNYVKIPSRYIWDCYFVGRSNPWGWATWSNKIKNVDWSLAEKNGFLLNFQEYKKLNYWGSDLAFMLKNTLLGKIRAWDCRLDYFMFKNDLYTVYPVHNLVKNIGFNRSDASNTTGYNRYSTSFSKVELYRFKIPKFYPRNKIIDRRFIQKNSILSRIVTRMFKFFNIKN